MPGITLQNLVVRLGLDLADFRSKMSQAIVALGALKEVAETNTASLKTLALQAGIAGAAITGALALAVRAAGEQQAVLARLNAVVKATGQSVDEANAALGRQRDVLRQSTAASDTQIASLQALQVSQGLTIRQVEELTPRILDLAAAQGRSAEEVAFLVTRGLAGFTFGLRRLNLDLPAARGAVVSFADVVKAMDKAGAGAAAAFANTLPGALAKFRNSVQDLLQTIGGPFLAVVTKVLQVLTFLVNSVNNLIKFLGPLGSIIVFAAGTMAAAVGITLVLTASLVGLSIAALRAAAAYRQLAGSIGATSAIEFTTIGIKKLREALLLLFPQLGGVSGRIGELIRSTRSLAGAKSVLTSAAGNLAGGFARLAGVVRVLFTFMRAHPLLLLIPLLILLFRTLDPIFKITERITGAFRALAEGINAFVAPIVDRVKQALGIYIDRTERATGVTHGFSESVEEAQQKLQLLEAQAKRSFTEAELAAIRQANEALLQPGISEERLQAILARREGIIKAAQAREAAVVIRGQQNVLKVQTDSLRAAEEQFKKVSQTQRVGTKAYNDALEQLNKTQTQVAQTEASIAAKRAEVDKAFAESRAELARSEAAANKALLQERLNTERQIAQAGVEILKSAEDRRLAVLRLGIEREIDAMRRLVDARERIATLQGDVELQNLQVRISQRQRQVESGLADEIEIAKLNLQEELRVRRDAAQRQADFVGVRLNLERAVAERSIRLAREEAESKNVVLRAELDARVKELEAERGAKEAELENSKALADAQLEIAIQLAKAQLEVQKQSLRNETQLFLAELDRRGVLTPELAQKISRRLVDQIADLDQSQLELESRLADQRERINVTTDARIAANRESFAAQIDAARQVEANKEIQNAVDLTNKIDQTQAGLLEKQVAGLETLRTLRGELLGQIEDLRTKLPQVFEGLTPEQVNFMLQGFTSILNGIDQSMTSLTASVTGGFNDIAKAAGITEEQMENLASRAGIIPAGGAGPPVAFFAPGGSFGKGIKDLADIMVDVPNMIATGTGAAVRAGINAASGAGEPRPPAPQFFLNGATIQVTPDERRILERVFSQLLGPEGNREFQKFLDRTVGKQPTSAAASGASAGVQ